MDRNAARQVGDVVGSYWTCVLSAISYKPVPAVIRNGPRMRIELINLDRSGDRLASFTSANAHLSDVRRFAAADGQQIKPANMIRAGMIDPAVLPRFTPGALGCALSHLILWKRAIAERTPLTITEDDAIFHFDFERHAADALKKVPETWDIIFWGINCGAHIAYAPIGGGEPRTMIVDRDSCRARLATFQGRPIAPVLYRLLQMAGTVCYSISPKGAAALTRLCLPLRPIIRMTDGVRREISGTLGVDLAMNEHYPRLQAFLCEPPLALSPNDPAKSTVQVATKPAR